MMGDFNFHVNDVADTTAKRFLSIVDDLNLRQHITGPTHISGNTLDLVLTRPSDQVLLTTQVSTMMSDHNWVHLTIDQSK